MFSFTNFLGMDSGESGGTTIAGMDLAAFAEVSTVATGGSQSQAIDNADQALWDDGFQEDADDEVVYTPAENPN